MKGEANLMEGIPAKIYEVIKNKPYHTDHVGMSDSGVFVFEDMVLKIQSEGTEAENEALNMKWLAKETRNFVPEILCYACQGGKSYLLMSKIEGNMLCAAKYLEHPEICFQILADGFQCLWNIDFSSCPCDSSLDQKLKWAEYNVKNHLVDMENVELETFGEKGFKNPEELLDWLKSHRLEEEPVLSHGDFCLPNIFAKGDRFSGLIDLGRMGIADRWVDLAICYRSLKHNFEGRYGGKTYPGARAEGMFDALGIQPDWEKIRYYILLDELF